MVVSRYSLEHFGNPSHIFEEVYRVLKKGGIFRVETVNVSVFWIRFSCLDWNKLWRHKIGTKRTGHLIHWTPDMLKMWFEINKFKPRVIKGNHLFNYQIIIEGKKC